MRTGTIDLHIHSTYSDGTLTPAEIVRLSVQYSMKKIAVCDHNVVTGSLEAEALARAAGLDFVRGVEIDAMLLGCDTHILCYGADFSDERLSAVVRDARSRLDAMSDVLLERMLPSDARLSREEYDRTEMDHARGGWKLLQYLADKGVTTSLKDGFELYERYGVGYETAGFCAAADVIEAIHGAGGCAVLAHPGVTFDRVDEGLAAALDAGVDGVECFYPKHDGALAKRLAAFCRENRLSMTAGSDCHGAFGSAQIGQTCAGTVALLHPALLG